MSPVHTEGAGSYQAVKNLLRAVESGTAEPADAARLSEHLKEISRRAERARRLAGTCGPVELSPYVLELLRAAGSRRAPVREEAVHAATG